jgi:hypothetical protein
MLIIFEFPFIDKLSFEQEVQLYVQEEEDDRTSSKKNQTKILINIFA